MYGALLGQTLASESRMGPDKTRQGQGRGNTLRARFESVASGSCDALSRRKRPENAQQLVDVDVDVNVDKVRRVNVQFRASGAEHVCAVGRAIWLLELFRLELGSIRMPKWLFVSFVRSFRASTCVASREARGCGLDRKRRDKQTDGRRIRYRALGNC